MRSYVIVLSAVAVAGLAGCSQQSQEVHESQVGMANPASVHCEKVGGKVEIEKDAQGNQKGICHLPDGARVDEWELFRRDQAQKPG